MNSENTNPIPQVAGAFLMIWAAVEYTDGSPPVANANQPPRAVIQGKVNLESKAVIQ